MRSWSTVERARVADGSEFVLARHGDDWVVRVDQHVLMSSRKHDSEMALAEHALALVRGRAKQPQAVLIGGLGLGYTLRAVLDRVGLDAQVTVVELVPELVDWNRKHLGQLNAHPLADDRCRVVIGDVFDSISEARRSLDAILLDVDNGPHAVAQPQNRRLYGERGLRACHRALRPGGVLGVWSAGPSTRFERALKAGGFRVEVRRVPARIGARAKHVLFLAQRRDR